MHSIDGIVIDYCGIGRAKIRELTDNNDCPFVIWNGNKRLIKRKQMEDLLNQKTDSSITIGMAPIILYR